MRDNWSAVTIEHLDDIEMLPESIRSRVEAVMGKQEIIALAQSCNLPIATVALILVALQDRDHDRNAGRFVRQVKKSITPDALEKIEALAIV